MIILNTVAFSPIHMLVVLYMYCCIFVACLQFLTHRISFMISNSFKNAFLSFLFNATIAKYTKYKSFVQPSYAKKGGFL